MLVFVEVLESGLSKLAVLLMPVFVVRFFLRASARKRQNRDEDWHNPHDGTVVSNLSREDGVKDGANAHDLTKKKTQGVAPVKTKTLAPFVQPTAVSPVPLRRSGAYV